MNMLFPFILFVQTHKPKSFGFVNILLPLDTAKLAVSSFPVV